MKGECRFRTDKGHPQLWDPLTGETRPLSEYEQKDDITTIPLEFEAFQSFFVVFPEETRTSGRENITSENFPQYSVLMELKGAWKVSFDPAWGGPEEVVFANLEDWTDRAEEGIRHYSGIHSQP